MAYVKKADRKPKEPTIPTNINELKSTLSTEDVQYMERLEAYVPKVTVPKHKRYFIHANFFLLRELGINNKVKHPQLISGLIDLVNSAHNDDIKCEAETLLAVHGSTQVFGWIE